MLRMISLSLKIQKRRTKNDSEKSLWQAYRTASQAAQTVPGGAGGDRAGVQAVSKWECGTALPDVELLLELSHLYGVSINALLEDTDILKPLTDQEYRMDGAAVFDSGAELSPEWAADIVEGKWIARNWR